MPPSVVGYTTHKLWGNNYVTWAVATVQDMANALEDQTIGSFKIPTDQMFGSGDSIKLEIWVTMVSSSARIRSLTK